MEAYSKTLSPDQKRVLDLISHGHNVLILGPAGSGKSTFLRHCLLTSQKKNIVLAPTGISALNVGGQTIHSFFRFPPSTILKDLTFPQKKYRKYKKIQQIIIDEISMVRIDVFEAIDLFLRRYGSSPHQPFGGVQIILIGDLLQLPPIVSLAERSFFQKYWPSPYFFKSPSFTQGQFTSIQFQKIFRQQETQYQQILNEIRFGTPSTSTFDFLNSRVLSSSNPLNSEHPTVTLTARRLTFQNINTQQLTQLPSPTFTYNGQIEGKFRLSPSRLPSPLQLNLKQGAQVVFTKNDPKGQWVNGLIGQVVHLDFSSIQVKADNRLIHVFKDTWETHEYFYDSQTEQWDSRIVGSYTQYPLQLAWAMTIHKSQGQTLDSCLIDLEGGAFASGQFYVALSRCRFFNQLFLQRPVRPPDIKIDTEILDFLDKI